MAPSFPVAASEEAPAEAPPTAASPSSVIPNGVGGARPPRVTLLSGFLGSGKTTLLQHLLSTSPTGTRVAVVVNDMAEINIDASQIRRVTKQPQTDAATEGAPESASPGAADASGPPTLIDLSNGCICCTLRDDLVEHLSELARATPPFDAIVIESTGVAEPLPVAESFGFEVNAVPAFAPGAAPPSEAAPSGDAAARGAAPAKAIGAAAAGGSGSDGGGDSTGGGGTEQVPLNDIAPLDTLVTVVDVSTFGEMLATTDAPIDRWGPTGGNTAAAGAREGEAGATTGTAADDDTAPEGEAEDYRPLSQLLVEQVEFANVIVLNKTDLVSDFKIAEVRAKVRALNRKAVLVEASHGRVPFGSVVATHAYNVNGVWEGPGWLADLRATVENIRGATPGVASASGTDAAVRSELEEFNLSSFVYRRRRPFHPSRLPGALDTLCSLGEAVLRAKGFVWLATRHSHYGELSKAGATWGLSLGDAWLIESPQYQRLAARKLGAPVPAHVPSVSGPDGDTSGDDETARSAAEEGATEAGAEESEDDDDAFAAKALSDIVPVVGDRRQEVVFIGRGMSRPMVEMVLDGALLTDAEYGLGSKQWASFDDPLESWSDDDDEDAEDDGSGSGDDSDSGSAGGGAEVPAGAPTQGGRRACPDTDCVVPHADGKRSLAGSGTGVAGNEQALLKRIKPL